LSLLREAVIRRDRACLLWLLDATHQCRDQWGEPHQPTALDRLTLEHVREHPGGQRRDSEGWCVAMCHVGNIEHAGSTTETRRRLNDYLLGIRAMQAMVERRSMTVSEPW
jgi:hypothetical protein